MKNHNFIEKNIKRISRSWMLTIYAVFFLVILFGWVFHDYFRGLIFGPTVMTGEQIASIRNIREYENVFVRFEPAEAYQTNITMEKKTYEHGRLTRTEIIGRIAIAFFSGRVLIIEGEMADNTNIFEGFLKENSKPIMECIPDLSKNLPETKGRILPFYLKDTEHPVWYGLIFLVLLAAFGVWRLIRTLSWILDRNKHPLRKKLASYGDYDVISGQINNEIPEAIKYGDMRVTESWMFRKSFYDLAVIRQEDIVWIYKQITQHKMYYVVPAGKSYSMAIKTRKSQSAFINCSEKECDLLSSLLTEKMPHIISGYSEELAKLWNSNRQELFNVVDERKRNLQGTILPETQSGAVGAV